jgi:type II secretory pathway pseudopilin PulG
MTNLETYLLEELRQSDQKMQKLNDVQLSLVKFYFTTIFSLGTVIIALYNYGIFKETDILIPWFLLLPLLLFGFVVYYSLKRALIEYEVFEHTRNEVSEFFIYGTLKHSYKLLGSPLKPFYTLVSWIITGNIFAFIYTAIPYFRDKSARTLIVIAIAIFISSVMFTIVLVSLNTARKKARDVRRIGDIRMLQLALEMYYDDNKKYPITDNMNELANLLSGYMKDIPVDPLNKDNFRYKYESKDGKTYSIKYFSEQEGEKTATSND